LLSFNFTFSAKMSATVTMTSHPEITADNVAVLFPEVDTSLAREILPTSQSNITRGSELEGYDEEQVRLMDEVCIVLDNNDRPIGSASKKLCTFCSCALELPLETLNGGVVAGTILR
jgi:hypothetical protein